MDSPSPGALIQGDHKEGKMKTVSIPKTLFLVSILFIALAWSIPGLAQDSTYTVYGLGTLGGPATWAYHINDAGQIVGKGDTTIPQEGGVVQQAFIGTKDGIRALFANETVGSSAKAINNGGIVAGFKVDNAFLADSKAPLFDFGPFPNDTVTMWGLGINNSGNVAGWDGFWEKTSNGYNKILINNLEGSYTRATSINDSDQVAGFRQNASGYRAFRWQRGSGDGVITDLNVLSGFGDSYATRISNKGEVVGYSLRYEGDTPFARACLWKNDGNNTPIDLGSLGKDNYSEAYGINDAGVVVGMSTVEGKERAFIWDSTNGVRDLTSLLPAGSGWVLGAAYAINNNGQIVGYGWYNGIKNPAAFLLVPTPADNPDGAFDLNIDILPWNSHNRVNWQTRWGLIPVAILSASDFNAPREVAKKSLTFGRTGSEDSLAFCAPWNWDVNHDGRKDLICYFHEGPTKFKCDDKEGVLKGKTKDGEEFTGRDYIQVVPCPPHRHYR
jgi:probable HAF family extracellular repeat protein